MSQIPLDWCPFAVQHPLALDHSDVRHQPPSEITLHVTEGTTESGAFATFAASLSPNRVSAHFIVGRDGTIWQLVALSRVAWHASQVNYHSIGIEHVALSAAGAAGLNRRYPNGAPFVEMLATEEQYSASAKLLAWLCAQAKIPCDRVHIRTHHEASPIDHHDLCCTGALNPDRVVEMAAALFKSAEIPS
jgi:N-acetyl-anhydromuramyl-L-alanine amidase AmpD